MEELLCLQKRILVFGPIYFLLAITKDTSHLVIDHVEAEHADGVLKNNLNKYFFCLIKKVRAKLVGKTLPGSPAAPPFRIWQSCRRRFEGRPGTSGWGRSLGGGGGAEKEKIFLGDLWLSKRQKHFFYAFLVNTVPELGEEIACKWIFSGNWPNGGIWYSTICWWSKTSREEKKPGAVSRSPRQHMDCNSFISQLTGA